MDGYFGFLIAYVGPFIGAAALFLIWAWSAYKLRDRYPKYYNWCLGTYNNLPKVVGVIIIIVFVYFYFTTPTIYNE